MKIITSSLRRTFIAIALVTPLVAICADQFYGKRKAQGPMINSVRLLSTPERYDSKRVFADGFIRLLDRRYYLFTNKDDASRYRMNSAFLLSFAFDISQKVPKDIIIDGRWIAVEGTFRGIPENVEPGYGGGFIEDISAIVSLEPANK